MNSDWSMLLCIDHWFHLIASIVKIRYWNGKEMPKATWNLEVIQKKGKNIEINQTNKLKRDVVIKIWIDVVIKIWINWPTLLNCPYFYRLQLVKKFPSFLEGWLWRRFLEGWPRILFTIPEQNTLRLTYTLFATRFLIRSSAFNIYQVQIKLQT